MLPSIILNQEQVPLGARVHAFMSGKDTPEQFDGETIILRAMLSTYPITKKLYPQNDIDGIENILETAKFSPVETYSTKDSPKNARYAVFVNGKIAYPFEVAKSSFNRFYISTEFPFIEYKDSGKPSFEADIDTLSLQLRLFEHSYEGDNYLIKELKKFKEEIDEIIKKYNDTLRFEVCNLERKSRLFLETLIRQHRDKPGEIVSLLEKLESHYLREADLCLHTTELVRVD